SGCLGQFDVCGQAPFNTKIIGGQNATAGSWPWQASIHKLSTGDYICSGTLINKEWVLTSAYHVQYISVSEIVIYLGRLTQNGSNPHEISRTVTEVIKHPNDSLALLQLSSFVTFTDYIKPVCLAAAGSEFDAGTESWVTGWGWNRFEFLDILQELESPVVDNTACNAAYETFVTDKHICAEFLDGKGPCAKDDGNPLVARQGSVWIQSGVFDSRFGCGLPGFPTLYFRVSEYQDWISNYTSSSELGFVSYPIVPVIVSVLDGGSVNILSFSYVLAFFIIPLILLS
ncbi:serine protease 27-like, partial [Labeo rohita]|uniref:serine protease 27-like n=1 Tax=Labeo rohita TaxID=84645 RepID=UPI0021E24152